MLGAKMIILQGFFVAWDALLRRHEAQLCKAGISRVCTKKNNDDGDHHIKNKHLNLEVRSVLR